jgi:hypothetical protein
MRQMHTAYIPDTVAHNSKRVCDTTFKISVLTLEVHKEDRSAKLVEKLHVHVCCRACSFNVSGARDYCVCALVVLLSHNTYI